MNIFYDLHTTQKYHDAFRHIIDLLIQNDIGNLELEQIRGMSFCKNDCEKHDISNNTAILELSKYQVGELSQLATIYVDNPFFEELYQDICQEINRKIGK